MTRRRSASPLALFALLALSGPALADRYTTENFVTDAPTKELARTFGEAAEKYRVEKAQDWLGYEMPRWPQRCPLKVTVTMGSAGGATTFTFGTDANRKPVVLAQEMKIYGDVDKLLTSVLPHEVTHTVLAHHFGQAVPRWADEGGSVLSENDDERYTHDVRCRELLNQGRGIPLRHLFQLTEYPKDMIVVYAQGYSVCQYLIDQGGRRKFLQFVGTGMRNGNKNWEEAVQLYGYNSPDELQEDWIEALRKPPKRLVAAARTPAGSGDRRPEATPTGGGRSETRTSAVSGLPALEPPVVARGAMPDDKPAARAVPELKLLPPEPPSPKR